MPNYFILFLFTMTVYLPRAMSDANIRVSKLSEIPVDEIELDYSELANLDRLQNKENQYFKKDYDLMLKAKFKLINGDLKMAGFYLNQINDQTTSILPVKKRYLALIEFINGKFKNSLEYLSDSRMNNLGTYSQICLLKLVNLMALDLTLNLREESQVCMAETQAYSRNDQFWLDTMIKIKTKNKVGVKRNMMVDIEKTLSDDEMSRIWLKTGLYLSRESDLLKILSLLPESSYQSKKIREIVALMYLRDGDKARALMFVDDLESANAENIKGNINLLDKQYELAFGHFKLALQKKSDSENALERSIPISWLLNQFEDGLSMLNQVANTNIDKRKKSAIRAAYLIRLKKFQAAHEELLLLKQEFQNIPPFEVNIMDSYVNMILIDSNKIADKRKIEESSEMACKAYDGISCWIAMSYIHWENIGKTIKRDEDVFSDKTMTLESLKSKKQIVPLNEIITIDQKDIEELDSDTVHIK